jgi:hypothetical protein
VQAVDTFTGVAVNHHFKSALGWQVFDGCVHGSAVRVNASALRDSARW